MPENKSKLLIIVVSTTLALVNLILFIGIGAPVTKLSKLNKGNLDYKQNRLDMELFKFEQLQRR